MRCASMTMAIALIAAGAVADTVTITEPSDDRWMYPSNSTPGTRGQASTFSALPSAGGIDDRFGFLLIRFDTSAAIPAGLDPSSYRIRSFAIRATTGQDFTFSYDPTPDPLATFGTPEAEATESDSDSGRPVELHGAGFRNGFTAATFEEGSPHGSSSPGTRNAYPLGFDETGAPRDVSSNVTEAFDSVPWALGVTDGVEPGESVPSETEFTFHIDTTLPGVADYIRQGLAAGSLWFSISSLHPATQQAGEYASWLTRDDAIHQLFGDLAPSLTLDVDLGVSLTLERSEGTSSLSWPEFAGFDHILEATGTPDEPDWAVLHTHSSENGGIGGFTDTTGADRRFYRLRILPSQP